MDIKIQAVINVYTSQQQPRRGDMVQFQRSGYQHWGIYVGNGNVIHFTLPDWDCVRQDVIGGQTLLATVQRDRLADVAGRDPYAVHNQFDGDGEHPPLDPDVIVQMAEDLLGLQLPYNLLTSNCEHFATMMRYGVPQSGQTELFCFTVDPNFARQIRRRLRERQRDRVRSSRTVSRWFQRAEEL